MKHTICRTLSQRHNTADKNNAIKSRDTPQLAVSFSTSANQNVFWVNRQFVKSTNQYAHFDVKQVMKSPLILLLFWVFSYIIDEHSCLKYCILTKLSQIMCLIIVHILVCQHAKYACRLWRFLWFTVFFRILIYYMY